MYQSQYFVPKHSGTISDQMLAFGVAKVLQTVIDVHRSGRQVSLRDEGGIYVVDTGIIIKESWLEGPQEQIIHFVTTPGKYDIPEGLGFARAHNVDEEWETFRRYREQWNQLREAKVSSIEIADALEDQKPRPDWIVVTYLGDYRMQAQGIHNGLVEQWMRTNEQFPGLNLRTILALFASPTADWDDIASTWKSATKGTIFSDTVTASQLFNPHMGKGQNRPKANKLTMGNEKVFWLLEFLKAVGLWAAAVPTKASNADVRKTYTISPKDLSMARHERALARFRERIRNDGVVKQDIMASLLYTEVLLEQSIEDDALDIFGGGGVSNIVSGMEVATYQLLSQNSYTMMNLSFLGLPDWMPRIETTDDAYLFRDLLREHQERIRSIDEDRSEGYALLQLYRDFLSGNYTAPFFAFLDSYASYLMSAINRNNYFIKPFSETNLRRLFEMTEKKLTPILHNEGFRNIASAIRMSTIVPLYRGKSSSYETRFGLGQELLRHAQYRDEFVQALSKFIHAYNDETTRVQRRTGKQFRSLVTMDAIEKIVTLIDEYDSKTVCNLLVAFGYARDPREKSEDEGAEASQDTNAEVPF